LRINVTQTEVCGYQLLMGPEDKAKALYSRIGVLGCKPLGLPIDKAEALYSIVF